MNKKTIFLLVILFGVYFPMSSHAAFLDFGWGARPTGMGGAFTAVSDDANAPMWNPAGLGRVGTKEVMFMHAIPYTGMTGVNIGYNFASLVLPMKENIFGLSWTGLNNVGYSENSFNLSYARAITENMFIGGNFKYLGHGFTTDAGFDDPVFDSGATSKYGMDADAGFLFCLPNKFCIGGSISNLMEADIGLYDVDTLKKAVRAGIAYYPTDDITIAVDVDYKDIHWTEIFGGFEMWFMRKKFAVRAGTNYRSKMLHEITAGATFRQHLGKTSSVTVDYCFIYPLVMSTSSLTHRFALTMGF